MWAAGPPKATKPSLVKSRATSATEPRSVLSIRPLSATGDVQEPGQVEGHRFGSERLDHRCAFATMLRAVIDDVDQAVPQHALLHHTVDLVANPPAKLLLAQLPDE